MNRCVRVLAVLAVLAVILSAAGCSKLRARDELNKGVQSFKAQDFEQAVNHFQKSVEYDPTFINARIYLATAYAQQFTPGNDDRQNMAFADNAIKEFNKVLEMDPKNVLAVKNIASLYFNMKKFDDAKKFHHRVIELDPNDAEAYYSVGVIDWTQSYAIRQPMRNNLHLKGADNITDKKVCADLQAKNSADVEEGLQMLDKAIKLRADYDDAMAYMNLMYRERADYECSDPAARAADLKAADGWVNKALATKQAKDAKAGEQAGGIQMDETKKDETAK